MVESLTSNERFDTVVMGICTAYESGFGQGLQGRATPNPYQPLTQQFAAWEYGHWSGTKKKSYPPRRWADSDYCKHGFAPGHCWKESCSNSEDSAQKAPAHEIGEPAAGTRITEHSNECSADRQPVASVLETFVRQPDGYAYRYHDYRGDVIRFNGGAPVNGSNPFEAVPYWLGRAEQPIDANGNALKACEHPPGDCNRLGLPGDPCDRNCNWPECGCVCGTDGVMRPALSEPV